MANLNDLLQSTIQCLETEFEGALNTEELFDCVNELLLGQVDFVIEKVQGKTNKYKAQIKSKIGIKKFVEIYLHQTNETLRCDKKKDLTEKYKLRQYYRCQHNTKYLGTNRGSKILARKPQKRFKNTNCEFLMFFSITNVIGNEFPCSITIECAHNHRANSLQAWGFKDVSQSVKYQLRCLFESGMSAGTAYKEFHRNLRISIVDKMDLHRILADWSKVPRRNDFNALQNIIGEILNFLLRNLNLQYFLGYIMLYISYISKILFMNKLTRYAAQT